MVRWQILVRQAVTAVMPGAVAMLCFVAVREGVRHVPTRAGQADKGNRNRDSAGF